MAAQPAPAGAARPRPARRVSTVQDVVVLVDWWLKRVEGDERKVCVQGFRDTEDTGEVAPVSKGGRKGGARLVATSAAIAKRLDHNVVETVDGVLIRFMRICNYTRMRENGFSDEVSESFMIGFPVGWEKILNPNMELVNGHGRSPSKPGETCNAFNSSRGYASNTDGPPIQRHSNVSDGNTSNNDSSMSKMAASDGLGSGRMGIPEETLPSPVETCNAFNSSRGYASKSNVPPIKRHSNVSAGNTSNKNSSMSKMAASDGLGSGRMDIPEEPLASPGETCNTGQADDLHESMHIGAKVDEIVNRSVSVKQSTGPMRSYSNVDSNRSAPSKIASVEVDAYRKGVGCGETEQDAFVEHGHSCSSEQEMVTPIDSALVNNYMSRTSSDIGEHGTPKCGEASVNLGTAGATGLPIERMTPQASTVQGLQDSRARRLRNGKVCGMPCGAPRERGNKRKIMQHEASSKKGVQGLENNKVTTLRSGKVFGTPCGAPVEGGNKRKKMQHEASNKKKVVRSAFS
ncbi:hypothetical protein ACP70R_005273 [Stipagrostis hirtigluma subsp. patula]